MAKILGPTPDEIKILLEIARPVGTSFEVIEDFKGKCFEHRRAMATSEEPRALARANQDVFPRASPSQEFERLPEQTKMFFLESAGLMTFEPWTDFSSKITEILVMWAEAREMQGKKLEEIQSRKRPDVNVKLGSRP